MRCGVVWAAAGSTSRPQATASNATTGSHGRPAVRSRHGNTCHKAALERLLRRLQALPVMLAAATLPELTVVFIPTSFPRIGQGSDRTPTWTACFA